MILRTGISLIAGLPCNLTCGLMHFGLNWCTFLAQNQVIHSINVFIWMRTLTSSTSWLPSCGAGVSVSSVDIKTINISTFARTQEISKLLIFSRGVRKTKILFGFG